MAINERRLRKRAQLDRRIATRPELSQLKGQLRDRKDQFSSEVRTAQDTGRINSKYATAQVPTLTKLYDDAAARQSSSQAFANQVAPTAIGPASALQAAILAEGQRQQGDIQTNKANAVTQAHTDSRRALEGAQVAVSAARNRFGADQDKILQAAADTLAKGGDIEAKAFADYLEGAQKQEFEGEKFNETKRSNRVTEDRLERTADETARHNRATEKKNGKKDKPRRGPGSLTQSEENNVYKALNVDEAREWIKRMGSGKTPADDKTIRSTLLSGKKISTGDSIPKFDKDAINIAFDLERKGHVSQPNVKRLHGKGVHVKPEWIKKKKKNKYDVLGLTG